MLCCFRSENSDALLYLKLWYSFYMRVEYQRLHENNLARRRQLMRVAWRIGRFKIESLLGKKNSGARGEKLPVVSCSRVGIGVTLFKSAILFSILNPTYES
jgi:hypothetical protein